MPPMRRLTTDEVAAWLDRTREAERVWREQLAEARARNEARRAQAAPEPVTDDAEIRLRQVRPEDRITIPERNAYEVLRVLSSTPVAFQVDDPTTAEAWRLRVVVDEAREEDVVMPADTLVTRHHPPDPVKAVEDDGPRPYGPGGIEESFLRVMARGGSIEEARAAGRAQREEEQRRIDAAMMVGADLQPGVNPGLMHREASGNGSPVVNEPDLVRDASAVPVVGPPPSANRVDFPYQGTIDFQGIPINVENIKGSTRSGTSPDGTTWSITMGAHYGEVAGSVGADGDAVDVYVGDDANAPEVYVFQVRDLGSGDFDEVKAFLGYRSLDAAVAAFRAHYDRDGFLMGVATWPVRDFHAAMLRRSTSSGRLDAPGERA